VSEDSTRRDDFEVTNIELDDGGSLPKIAHYRILQKVGEGGMGEVYEAEQEQPIRRKVALKVIKHGMDTKSVVARFESERQALAMMDHASIAKVYEAGVTQHGRPYFAMEFVQGIPVTEHCDRARLNTPDRLKLFIQACEGVQHAHQKAIIHRDLKPSNVLVAIQDGRAVPKIIDFGVAKATAQRLTDKTMFTELGQLIGTPEFMSPEQADMTGQNIDTRTDVYALGAMLYVLLVGALPFESKALRQAGFDELRRRIREVDPPRPSTRFGTLGSESEVSAKMRGTNPTSLTSQLKGDLDWIVMKALEKDRTRRYGSPNELAADIRRHLEHQPVLASPPSTLYRMRKFVRRHRVGVASAAALLIVLVAFAVDRTVQARRIAVERDRASQEAATSRFVSDFMVGLFQVSDPSESRGNRITAREILDVGAETIRDELADRPLVQARLMSTMGDVYTGLGLFGQALPLLEESLAIREMAGSDDPELAATARSLAILLVKTGQMDRARPLFLQALEIRERAFGPDHPDVAQSLSNLGRFLHFASEYEEALPLLQRALGIRRRVLGPDHPDVAKDMNNVGAVLLSTGDYERALPMFEQSVAIYEKVLEPNHPDLASSMNNLATALSRTGDPVRARDLYERTLALQEKVKGADHPDVATALNNLASLIKDSGDLDGARARYERALTIQRSALGPSHPDVAMSLNNLAELERAAGSYTEARSLYRRALVIWENALGVDHADLVHALEGLAFVLKETGEHEEAERLFRRGLDIAERSDHPGLRDILLNFADLLRELGRESEAEGMEARAAAIRGS